MGDRTAIEWAQATWNPVTGCSKVSPGCDRCYAERFAERWRGVAGHPYEQGFDVVLHGNRLAMPARWTRPRTIFVNSMSDLWHHKVPDEFVDAVFDAMEATARHVYQILTKRSGRMKKYLSKRWAHGKAPKWIWVGVSVEDQVRRIRIDHLRATPAGVRFVSAEPLIGDPRPLDLDGIRWLIAGGESGPGARVMEVDWARRCREECRRQGVAFFFKQWGGRYAKSGGRTLDGVIHDAMPAGGSG